MAITTEYIDCPYCDIDDPQIWGEENGYRACRCNACGFVYVNPRPALAEIDEASKTGLHATETGQMDAVGRLNFRSGKVRMFRRRIPQLFDRTELSQDGLRWLDVGTGFGELVAAVEGLVSDTSKVSGIDPCEPKIRLARTRGLNVTTRMLSDISDKYDVVSSINVFSHVPDPVSFVSSLRAVLRPGGSLFLVTGNGADVDRADYPGPLYLPDHLIFAGKNHVINLLERNGFDVVRVNTYSHFYRESLPMYAAKRVVKIIMGHQGEPFFNKTGFRSLFVRAKLR